MRGPMMAVVALAVACGAPQRDPFPASDEQRAVAGATVGWLDDMPVTYGDVGVYLRTKEPETFSRGLEGLVLERVTRAEAVPLGVTVPDPLLRRMTNRRMREWEERVKATARRQTGEEIDPALWLQRVAGISVARLRTWVRRHTEVELLQDRLLRYEQLTSPRVELSILVVETGERAQGLAERARRGDDFATLARQHSVHESKPRGGAVGFPLVPADINDDAVRKALYEARAGAIVGPFPTTGGGRTFFQIYRVEKRDAARDDPYAALAAEVEGDLDRRPVPVGEYERWRRRILLRHGFVAAPQEPSQ